MSVTTDNKGFVVLGRITGVAGLQGGVKIQSYTRPREQIFSYAPWYLRHGDLWMERQARRARTGGRGLIAAIGGIADRVAASSMLGADIAVRREQLPELDAGEYYQTDLIGLDLVNMNGVLLGKLYAIEETGANDVMVVDGERTILIPLLMGKIVKHIDLENRIIQVDWNPEYR